MFVGFQQVAATSAVKTVTSLTIPKNAIRAQLQADTQVVRYTLDGTTPSQTSGMLLLTTSEPKEFLIEDIKNIKFIRGTTSDGNLNIHYYGVHDFAADVAAGITTVPVEHPSRIRFLAGLPLPETTYDDDETSDESS